MKIKKLELNEIIDGNGDLIGNDAIPTTGTDLETQAGKTSDDNLKISHQPFRYDMLGRFGFTLLPFMESVLKEGEIFDGSEFLGHPITNEIAKYLYDKHMETLKRYYKTPKSMQNEYRSKSKTDFETDESSQYEQRMAADILNLMKPYLDDELRKLDEALKENLVENAFIEGMMLDKKTEDELSTKTDDKDVRDKKLEKIAGLINKLEKKDIDALINILERKK